MKKILIVEDDPIIIQGLNESLSIDENYEIETATDGLSGYEKALKISPDLIILDIMLPGKNGLDICRDLRKNQITIPILMLTSKLDEIDKVLGFETGADDYVTKPFSIRELQMRIRALLRRSSNKNELTEEIKFGSIIINFKKLEAFKNDIRIELSAKEFQILKFLIDHEGEVISRDKLLDEVWGYDNYPTTRTVDNYVLNLRKVIEDNPSQPDHLLTVHTVGYKFVK